MARSYNGSSEYTWIANVNGLGTQPFTFACRMNPATLSPATGGCLTDSSALETGGATDSFGMFFFGATAGDPVACQALDAGVASGTAQSGASGFSAGSWYEVIASFISSTSRAVYGTGGISGTNSTSVTPTVNAGIHLGKRSEGLFFNGSICDVGGWTIELSASDRASYMAGFPARRIRPQSLAIYLPLVRAVQLLKGSGTVTDSSGSVTVHSRMYGR